MKVSSLAFGLALNLGMFALMSGAPNTAHAVDTNHSGTVCRNYNAAEAKDIDSLPSGTRNLNASPRYVICPVVRLPDDSDGGSIAIVSVYLNGYAASGQTITCTLNSYDYTGSFLGGNSVYLLTGTFEAFLQATAGYWSSANVLCLLPPSGKGIIYDIEAAPYKIQ
jgi:hypothetical protein